MADSIVIPIGVAGLLTLIRSLIHKHDVSQDKTSHLMRKSDNQHKKKVSVFLSLVWYLYSLYTGLQVLVANTEWVTNIDSVWSDKSRFETDPAATLFAQVSLGYYFYEFFVLKCTDYEPKRSDDKMMALHHLSTIALLAMCQWFSCVPVGILVLVLHDMADPLLNGAKLANYSGRSTLSSLIFLVFMVVFFLSRLVYFPFVVGSCLYVSIYGDIPYSFVMTSFLGVLLIMHAVWFSIIARMAYKLVYTGDLGGDARSDDDDV